MAHPSKWQSLPTEAINPATLAIDKQPATGVVDLMLAEDKKALAAVHRERDRIAVGADMLAKALRKGGRVVCAGIHMSDIPSFPYNILWQERVVRSVANLTRQDGLELMELAPRVPVFTHTVSYPLTEANRALDDLRSGRLQGAAVLVTA